jgi:hypothetical protein
MSDRDRDDEDRIIQYLHDLRTELQILNQQVRNGVLTDQMILAILEGGPSSLTTGSRLIQTSGGFMAGTLSIVAGKSGTFLRSNLPVGSFGLAKGTVPTYSVDDPAVTLGPDPSDATNTDKFSAAVPATDTGASFNVTVAITPAADATGAPGTPVSNVFNVTIVPSVAFVATTGSDLTQTS